MSETPPRGHEILAHTADAGLRAEAPDLPALFEEAAAALGELGGEVAPDAPLGTPDAIALEASDLAALAFAWLHELVGLADLRHAALARAEVTRVQGIDGSWRLTGRAWFVPRDGRSARPRRDIKSATYHGLAVERSGGGWRMIAYLDL